MWHALFQCAMYQRDPERNIPEAQGAVFPEQQGKKTLWVLDSQIQDVLISTVVQKRWSIFESFLTQLENHPRVRGAPLMRALNTPRQGSDIPLLGVMVCYGAPQALIERVIDLGAVTTFRCTLYEPSGGQVSGCSLTHLAVLKGRHDLLSIVPQHSKGGGLENSRGECPLRQFARIAPDRAFATDEGVKALGLGARRYLSAGGAGAELEKAVSMFLSRKMWGAAELVIDTWAGLEGLSEESKIQRSKLATWAVYGVTECAPLSLFDSLREAALGDNSRGELPESAFLQGDLLHKYIPETVRGSSVVVHDWSAFEARLVRLAACQGIVSSTSIGRCINSVKELPYGTNADPELVALGLAEGYRQPYPMSILQHMVYGAAPAHLLKVACKLGADLTYQAWVSFSGTTIVDGTAFHIAIRKGDMERMKVLAESGYPFHQINRRGESELHYLFSLNQGDLPLKKLPLLLAVLEAGASKIESLGLPRGVRETLTVHRYSLNKLLALVETYEDEGTELPKKTGYVPPTFEVADAFGNITIVDEVELIHAFEGMYRDVFGKTFFRERAFSEKVQERRETLESLEAKEIVRQLYAVLHAARDAKLSDHEPSQTDSDEFHDASSDHDSVEYFDDEALADGGLDPEGPESEYLTFPDLSGPEFGFTYDDPMLQDNDGGDSYDEIDIIGDSYDAEAIGGDATLKDEAKSAEKGAPSELPVAEGEAKAELVSPALFEESLLEKLGLSEEEVAEILADAPESAEELDPTTALIEAGVAPLVTIGGVSEPLGYALSPEAAFRDTVERCFRDGEIYEGYLLMKALGEIGAREPTKLSAISRSLRSLLYRFHPQVANHLGYTLDRMGARPNGYHPYMAEFLCLLHNPLDKRKDPQSIGGLTMGISSASRLFRYGAVTSDLVDAWGQIGTWNFSFPVFRFDAQAVALSPDGSGGGISLMEMAGMERVSNPVDEFWINPKTKMQEHLLGALFYVAPGTRFHNGFKYDQARTLGLAPLGRDTVGIFRRACDIFYHPSHGALVIRNSSHTFGRDRFRHPGLYSPKKRTLQDLLSLSQEEIQSTFTPVTAERFFDLQWLPEDSSPVKSAATPLRFLMEQARTIRAAYARLKFDCNYSTAWSPNGDLVGGYRSPLFKSVVELLENRWEMAQELPGKNIIIPDLAVANPDYFLAPHARLHATRGVIDVLRKLADGRESEISEEELRREGVGDFINASLMKGRSSELVLLAPEH